MLFNHHKLLHNTHTPFSNTLHFTCTSYLFLSLFSSLLRLFCLLSRTCMPPLGVLPTSGRRGAQAPSCEASPPRAGCWPVQSLAAGPTPYLYIRIALQFSSLCHLLSFCIPSKSHSLAAFVSRMCRLMYGVVRFFGLARVGEFVQVSVFGFLGLRSLPPRPSRPLGAASSSACPPACLLPACPPACSPPPPSSRPLC